MEVKIPKQIRFQHRFILESIGVITAQFNFSVEFNITYSYTIMTFSQCQGFQLLLF